MSSSDRNLLFGILAVQMDFVSREQLIAGMNAWVLEKSRALGEILHEQGHLDAESLQLLDALVKKHLAQHNNDPQQSLAAVSSIKSVRQDLEQLADSDVAASLVHVSQNAATDPFATRAVSAGDATSSGTRFRILRPHAQGGLGQVSVALDEELHREVALKEIKPEYVHRDDSRGRFLVEAEVTGGLEHPGIVPVYGLGTYADGRPYYAMRFIRGDSLKSAIETFHKTSWKGKDSERSLSLRKLLGRFVDVCNAIAYAHSRGVLHRDLKPGNIMLGNYGETLVVDWGLAKVQDRTEELDSTQKPLQLSSGSNSGQTVAGNAIGTPGYMSPEQAEGRLDLLGPATDVYSLGATLYNLLTGKSPIDATDVGEVLVRTIKGDIKPLHEIDSTLPKPLVAICDKAMALVPKKRYRTPKDLADDIEKYLADEPVTVLRETLSARLARVSRKHRGVVQAVLAALLLIAIIATGAAVWINAERREAVTAQETAEYERGNAILAAERERLTRIEESRQRALAERREREIQQQLYVSKIYRAAGDLESGRRAEAEDVLNTIPFEQRGWEARYLSRQVQGTPLTVRGHTGGVISVYFSPDGRRIVSGSWDKTIKVWDAATGTETLTLLGHSAGVTSVCFSPDGRHVVSGSDDETIKVWNATSGALALTLRGHNGQVNSVCFSPDGRRIVSGGDDRTIKVWDAASGAETLTLRGHTESVSSVCFSPDGRRIVSGSDDRTIKVWDAAGNAELLTLQGHLSGVTTVCFSPDGRRIVSGSDDRTIKVWDAAGNAELLTLRGHTDTVTSVCFNPGGSRIISGSYDNTIKVWDAASGTEKLTLRGHSGTVYGVSFSPDGRRIVSGSEGAYHQSGEIRVWDAARGAEKLVLSGHSGWVMSVHFSPDGRRIVSGSSDRTIKVWDAASGAETLTLRGHERLVSGVCFSPDGRQIASGSLDGTVKVWDVTSGTELLTLQGHLSGVTSVCFSPDGRRVVSSSGDDTIKIWDVATGAQTLTLHGHTDDVTTVSFSPDGRRIISGSNDETVKVWDAASGVQTLTLHGHTDPVTSVSFSPDGRWIVSGSVRFFSESGTIKVWDAASGVQTHTLHGHTGDVRSVCFSPDSRRIVSGSRDDTVKVWDVASGAETLTLRGHSDDVTSVCFSPDGRRIISGSNDETVKVWDAASGVQTLTLHRHTSWVMSVCFSPDGRRIVSEDRTDQKLLWDAATGERIDNERFPEFMSEKTTTEGGLLQVARFNDKVLLIRKNPDYDPWAEDAARRAYWDPIYHERDATAAEKDKDWFAARFHLRRLVQHDPDNINFQQRLATAEANYAAGQSRQPAVAEKSAH